MEDYSVKPTTQAAYFDFDGTLTTKDTLLPFLIHCVGWLKFILNLHRTLPVAVLYLLKIITNEVAKERTLIILLKGYPLSYLDNKAKSFAYSKITRYIRPDVFAKMEYHREHGHKVILISANLAVYLNYWAQLHSLDGVVATEIEFINNVASGRLATHNCYGAQKVLRLKRYLEENNLSFGYTYGYGNSKGDYELLEYVDEAYWVDSENFIPWPGRNPHD